MLYPHYPMFKAACSIIKKLMEAFFLQMPIWNNRYAYHEIISFLCGNKNVITLRRTEVPLINNVVHMSKIYYQFVLTCKFVSDIDRVINRHMKNFIGYSAWPIFVSGFSSLWLLTFYWQTHVSSSKLILSLDFTNKSGYTRQTLKHGLRKLSAS